MFTSTSNRAKCWPCEFMLEPNRPPVAQTDLPRGFSALEGPGAGKASLVVMSIFETEIPPRSSLEVGANSRRSLQRPS